MSHVPGDQSRRRAGAWLVAACLAVQGLLLALGGDGAAGRIAAGAGLVGLAPLAALAWRRGRRSFARDVVLVTLSIGGLGMLLGARADAALGSLGRGGPERGGPERGAPDPAGAAALHAAHEAPAAAHRHRSPLDPRPLASWMGVGMLATCAPACWLLCAPCPRRRRWAAHGACLAGMLAGMLAGGALAAPGAGAHLAMLAGMAAGSGLAGLPFARGGGAHTAWSTG